MVVFMNTKPDRLYHNLPPSSLCDILRNYTQRSSENVTPVLRHRWNQVSESPPVWFLASVLYLFGLPFIVLMEYRGARLKNLFVCIL